MPSKLDSKKAVAILFVIFTSFWKTFVIFIQPLVNFTFRTPNFMSLSSSTITRLFCCGWWEHNGEGRRSSQRISVSLVLNTHAFIPFNPPIPLPLICDKVGVLHAGSPSLLLSAELDIQERCGQLLREIYEVTVNHYTCDFFSYPLNEEIKNFISEREIFSLLVLFLIRTIYFILMNMSFSGSLAFKKLRKENM